MLWFDARPADQIDVVWCCFKDLPSLEPWRCVENGAGHGHLWRRERWCTSHASSPRGWSCDAMKCHDSCGDMMDRWIHKHIDPSSSIEIIWNSQLFQRSRQDLHIHPAAKRSRPMCFDVYAIYAETEYSQRQSQLEACQKQAAIISYISPPYHFHHISIMYQYIINHHFVHKRP